MKPGIQLISLKILAVIITLVITFAFIRSGNSELYGQEYTTCEERLDEADAEYQAGHWAESIELINECLAKSNLSETERGRAYRLLGLVYIAIELEKEASDAVKNLLIMVPNYKIDPDRDPPQLKKIIDDITAKLQPSITSITPDNADMESEGFNLTVSGSDFVYGSAVRFNGVDKATTYVGPNQLTAVIYGSDLMHAGEFDVTVFSPIHSGKVSNAVKFKVNEPSGALTWILIGGGAAVAAVVAIVVLGGGEDDGVNGDPGTFPTPPGRP